jgi:hypothetical protein
MAPFSFWELGPATWSLPWPELLVEPTWDDLLFSEGGNKKSDLILKSEIPTRQRGRIDPQDYPRGRSGTAYQPVQPIQDLERRGCPKGSKGRRQDIHPYG